MSPDFFNGSAGHTVWFVALFIWVMIWKGIALWRAARIGATWWFIALLVVNTLGILEILYIYVFSQKKPLLRGAA
jgi:uncharacterized protein DUF5652